MSTRTYTVEITKFRFPDKLEDKNANFRLQVDIRHKDEKGEFKVYTTVLPGLDLYWECSEDENRKNETKPDRQLVRKGNEQSGYEPEVDFTRAGIWGSRFRFTTMELYELRVTVFDVEQKNWLDKLSGAIEGVIKSINDAVKKMTGPLAPFVNEAAATIGRKINDNDDKMLVVHSGEYKKRRMGGGGNWSFKTHTGYEFEFTAKIESEQSS